MSTRAKTEHGADLCVIGGGMAGLCAALAAARQGARVILMHDRPVLGGNASSECRVHICGADRHNTVRNMRETGILEELRLENLARNPNRNYFVWDAILYDKIRCEPNVTLLLNCSCMDAVMEGDVIRSVTGWQTTTQTWHEVCAAIFADCSGDAVLAPMTGADHRTGRESCHEYGESIAPPVADAATMGMTCLFQAREYATPQSYTPPAWAYQFTSCDELPYGSKGHGWWQMGYWWVELGGDRDGIRDTEQIRDELLAVTLGVWDHIKNRCANRETARNWALDWLQFIPGKRESRRYRGAHVLTQNDIETGGLFDDVVAYGGWHMDDHHPAGFNAVRFGAPATIFHTTPSPYGIPYRCLYSRNVNNLMFAGRDASCTHTAMSSTRIQATGCCMGQALGTAAALAVSKDIKPGEVLAYISELQQTLLRDDAYLPGMELHIPQVTQCAHLEASRGDPEPVRDGISRPVENVLHAWPCEAGDWIAYRFERPTRIATATLVFDSALDHKIAMSYHQADDQLTAPPDVLPMEFRLEGLVAGQWKLLQQVQDNTQRLCRLEVNRFVEGVRFVLVRTWGYAPSHVFTFYMDEVTESVGERMRMCRKG